MKGNHEETVCLAAQSLLQPTYLSNHWWTKGLYWGVFLILPEACPCLQNSYCWEPLEFPSLETYNTALSHELRLVLSHGILNLFHMESIRLYSSEGADMLMGDGYVSKGI